MKCEICDFIGNGKKFSNHLSSKHKLKSIDYCIHYLHNGIRPLCLKCEKETRYSSFKFKKYCKDHSHIAESIGGKKGGLKQAWNKGKNKHTDKRLMKFSISTSGKNNHFYGIKHTEKSKQKISDSKKIKIEDYYNSSKFFEILTQYNNYKDIGGYLNVKCKECQKEDTRTMRALLRGSRCSWCYPITSSKAEFEICEFLKSLNVHFIKNTRNIISPKELDIYIESNNLAIEYHGLYWHRDNDSLAREKYELCKEKGIKLIQIFSDEWINNRNICESIIRNSINKIENKIHARKCDIKEIDIKKANELLNNWHIAGSVRASKAFCLFFNNEPVSIMTVRKPFHGKYNRYLEIARFSSKLNTVINGGLSKLLSRVKQLCLNEDFDGIVTYSDLRFGEGNGYAKCGFNKIHESKKNYWYTDCSVRYSRFKFRAIDDKSEKQIALENKVHKIYGAGNAVYILNI